MAFRYYKPKDRISKLNDYFELLDVLFHYEAGFTEIEFLEKIHASKGTNAPDDEYIFQQLLNFRLIEESNDFIPRYILSLPYREFLEYLYQESQPVNSAIIKGYISTLESRIDDLKKAYDDNSEALTLRFLKRLERELNNISQTSSRNRLGVIQEVRKLKFNDDNLSYKERLSEANRLWDEFLEPLREMISPQGSFGQIMDRLKETLEAGENKFNGQTELKQYFLQGRAKRIQLNEQTRLDLNEAQQELMPLREKLAQESRLMEAAGVIFGEIEQGNIADLPAFPHGRILRRERHIGLSGLRGYMAELWSLTTEPESIVLNGASNSDSAPLETESVLRLLKEMPDNSNVVDYFLKQHSHLTANEVLRAVSVVCLHQKNHDIHIRHEQQDYEFSGQTWRGISIYKGELSHDG